MRFHIVGVTTQGYFYVATVTADTLKAAAAMHVDMYRKKRGNSAYVMRDSMGKRYCVAESERICARPA